MLKNGFTLVELLIVIAIIGILYAVALPAYNRFVQEGRRADVQRLMLQYVAVLERNYTRLGGYPDKKDGITSDNQYYSFSYSPSVAAANTPGLANDSKTFILRAIPVVGSSQSDDICGTLTINHEGNTSAAQASCWR